MKFKGKRVWLKGKENGEAEYKITLVREKSFIKIRDEDKRDRWKERK